MDRNRYIDNMDIEIAIDKYINEIDFTKNTEKISSIEAQGRITSKPVFAKKSSPHYNSAAMDGIIVNSEKTKGASEMNPKILKEGEDFLYINTGNPILEGYDSVIMIEDVIELGDGRVQINQSTHPWQYVRNIGEDIVATEMILPTNHKIRALDLGAIISGGVEEVEVYKKPKVGIIPTGSEIVEDITIEESGKITDTNSFMLAGSVIDCGGIPKRYNPIPDEYDKLKSGIDSASKENDLLLIIAGSSAGSKDYTSRIIDELGEKIIHGIAVKPGKPTILGKVNGKPVIGIPGYPVSAYIAFDSFAKPILLRFSGEKERVEYVDAILSKRVYSSLKNKELIRMNIGKVDTKLIATPISGGAGSTTSLVRADGIGEVPRNLEGMESGEIIRVKLLKNIEEIEEKLVSIGSHDLIIDIISDKISLSSAHVGSMGGIISMRKKEAHIAPIHLLDENSGIYNISYVKRYIPNENTVIIKGVQRIQGFIVPKGNPKNIQNFEDLLRDDVVFINRQRGSGTRVLLDYKLKEKNIDAESIKGYDLEYNTHMDIAQGVKSGNADVGLGVYSAAKALGLDFIEVAYEDYDFLIYEKSLEDKRVKKFINIIKSEEFKKQLEQMGGYRLLNTGEIIKVE
ncbi:MAG: molybdopterin biosynthesis protein [Andreesenia angusta]|nr:molybdopterin biosynthesis protein [Andreesenia angusta]